MSVLNKCAIKKVVIPKEFASLLDAHFELKVDEHEFIAEYYIPTMSKALEEILPLWETQDK